MTLKKWVHDSMTPVSWVMTPILKGHGDSRYQVNWNPVNAELHRPQFAEATLSCGATPRIHQVKAENPSQSL